jgi:hypothetical protein
MVKRGGADHPELQGAVQTGGKADVDRPADDLVVSK